MRENKTKIYIDSSNIILSSLDIGFEIDFEKLFIYLKDRFRTEEIFYFTPNLKKIAQEIETLKIIGYKIVLKEIYYENNKTKGNCDVEISHYITKHIENNEVDTLVLLSGDGDFSFLIDYALNKNISVYLMPSNLKSSSKILRIKKKSKIVFLDSLRSLIEKEKTPTNT